MIFFSSSTGPNSIFLKNPFIKFQECKCQGFSVDTRAFQMINSHDLPTLMVPNQPSCLLCIHGLRTQQKSERTAGGIMDALEETWKGKIISYFLGYFDALTVSKSSLL